MNVCMSIVKDLVLCYTKCLFEYYKGSTVVLYQLLNCYRILFEYYKGSIVLLYKMLNCYEYLYEYYEGSIVVLYWTLTIMNSCICITKDLSLYYTEC
jgi:hypothetical protein